MKIQDGGYDSLRKQVQAELQWMGYLKPMSFEVFKKTDHEKGLLLTAKSEYKNKNGILHSSKARSAK